jgi:flagellar FliL protein
MAAKQKKPEAEADAEDAPAKPAGKSRLLRLGLIGVAALVLLGGAGGGIYHFFFAHKAATKVAAPVVKPPTFFDLPEVLVNLSNTDSERTQYLKVKVVLELADPTLVQKIQPLMPRVMDTFQTFLRQMRPSDLEGSAGVYRLREELTRRVNLAIAPSHIDAVLFKEIVVQ